MVVLCSGTCYICTMNRYDKAFPGVTEARIKYLDADYQIISHGQFVRCAVTGNPIKLDELRYWCVDRQEAYTSAHEAVQRKLELDGKN